MGEEVEELPDNNDIKKIETKEVLEETEVEETAAVVTPAKEEKSVEEKEERKDNKELQNHLQAEVETAIIGVVNKEVIATTSASAEEVEELPDNNDPKKIERKEV